MRELSGDRDVRDDGRASWELVATYGFELDGKADVRVTIPALNDRIYESAFESQLTFFGDPQGRVHGVDDAFEPAWFSLAKGKWEVVLHLRGEDRRYVFQGVYMHFDCEAADDWGRRERLNQLIFIGRGLDRREFVEGFKSCLTQS